MKVPKLPKNIKVHPNVWRSIKEIKIIDEKKAGRLIQRIIGLGYDPIPYNDECDSKIIWNLYKKKVSIRRLKCLDIMEYRIFYAYRKSRIICVYYIVERSEDTYKKNSIHYQFIKLLYTQWKGCQ